MNLRGSRTAAAGFTLIEVIVAMFVIAMGIGALLSTLSVAADNVGYLRDKSLAEWVALNRISELRLQKSKPGTGETTGETEFAGAKWPWRQIIVEQDVEGILRIDVAVARPNTKPATDESGEDYPSIVTAYGFVGTQISAPNGMDPPWAVIPIPARRGGAP